MTEKKSTLPSSLEALLTAAQEDEQLQLCDELARGDKTAAEVDAALGPANPRIQRLRQMSEPLTANQKERLTAMLLQSAPAQPALTAVPGGVAAPKPSARRIRVLSPYMGVLALAAAFAIYFAFTRDGGQLPQLALEATEHNSTVLGASTPASAAGIRVHPGSCLDLRLRPERSYRTTLQTAVWIAAEGPGIAQQLVPWPVQLHQTEKGVLQGESCATLPSAVAPGSWQLVVVYGRELPSAAEIQKALAEPAARAATTSWQMARQPLQVVAASQ